MFSCLSMIIAHTEDFAGLLIYICKCVMTFTIHWQAKASGRTAEDCGINGDETCVCEFSHHKSIPSCMSRMK